MIGNEGAAREWLQSLPEYSDLAADRLERFASLLSAENCQQNLVSKSSLDHLWQRHIADSAQLLSYVPRGTSNWLDLGTGAGFPGLIVAILRPDCEILLVEARSRRADWLESVRIALGLDNATVIRTRVENVDSRHVKVISGRAFAPLGKLLGLSARFSTVETIWLLPKGRSAQQELDELRGWRHAFHVEQSITDPSAGIIVGKLSGRKEGNS